MQLEALCDTRAEVMDLPLVQGDDGVLRCDWQPLLEILGDASLEKARRAERFHAAMAGAIHAQARAAREQHAVTSVGLGGGVFQNRFLTEQVQDLLEADGFDVFLPLALPCNDAALSYGQAAELAAREMDS